MGKTQNANLDTAGDSEQELLDEALADIVDLDEGIRNGAEDQNDDEDDADTDTDATDAEPTGKDSKDATEEQETKETPKPDEDEDDDVRPAKVEDDLTAEEYKAKYAHWKGLSRKNEAGLEKKQKQIDELTKKYEEVNKKYDQMVSEQKEAEVKNLKLAALTERGLDAGAAEFITATDKKGIEKQIEKLAALGMATAKSKKNIIKEQGAPFGKPAKGNEMDELADEIASQLFA